MKTIDIQAVKAANAAAGQHYFSPSTMRFFRSRVASRAYQTEDGRVAYFWTSEQFVPSRGPAHPRLYSVRVIELKGKRKGSIDTVGDFQQYPGVSTASYAAKQLAQAYDAAMLSEGL